MITRKQALYTLSQDYELSLIYELEPERTEFLVDLAFECITVHDQKRASLADLKLYTTRLVGSNAVCPELRMSKYENKLHAYLDWLLNDLEVKEAIFGKYVTVDRLVGTALRWYLRGLKIDLAIRKAQADDLYYRNKARKAR